MPCPFPLPLRLFFLCFWPARWRRFGCTGGGLGRGTSTSSPTVRSRRGRGGGGGKGRSRWPASALGGEGLRSGAGASGLSDSVQGDRERLVEVLGGDGGGTKRARGRGGSLSMPPPAATQAAMGITRWPPSTTAVSCTPLRRTTTLLMHGPAPVAPRAPPKARALDHWLP